MAALFGTSHALVDSSGLAQPRRLKDYRVVFNYGQVCMLEDVS
jgi:hypothetical protein